MKAKKYAEQAYAIAQEIRYPSNLLESSRLLFRIYLKEKKYKDALQMHMQFVEMKDSLNNEKNQRDAATKLAKYGYEKEKIIDNIEHEKQLAIEKQAKKNQQLLKLSKSPENEKTAV